MMHSMFPIIPLATDPGGSQARGVVGLDHSPGGGHRRMPVAGGRSDRVD